MKNKLIAAFVFCVACAALHANETSKRLEALAQKYEAMANVSRLRAIVIPEAEYFFTARELAFREVAATLRVEAALSAGTSTAEPAKKLAEAKTQADAAAVNLLDAQR